MAQVKDIAPAILELEGETTSSIPERHCDVVALDNRSNLGFGI